MPSPNFFLLLDDIATLLDDVSAMTKVAAKKTATVLSDDLAVNAQMLTGLRANRELPVVWAVAKGSFKNKLILVPAALLISAFIPWLIVPLLLLGGLYLCFEGVEKVLHTFFHHENKKAHHKALVDAVSSEETDILAFEKKKIRGAINTDFILSAEIIVITLGIVSQAPLMTQIGVLSTVAIVITVGVYGLVAAIIKLDDAGLFLATKEGQSIFVRLQKYLGKSLLRLAPVLMRFLSVFGTIAMFLVGGGIISHNIHVIHELVVSIKHLAEQWPGGSIFQSIIPLILDLLIGFIAGLIVVPIVNLSKPLVNKVFKANKS